MGVDGRAAHRCGAANPPWGDPRAGRLGPRSGLRTNSVLGRSGTIRIETATPRSTTRRIRRNPRVTTKPLLLHARRFYYVCHPYGDQVEVFENMTEEEF